MNRRFGGRAGSLRFDFVFTSNSLPFNSRWRRLHVDTVSCSPCFQVELLSTAPRFHLGVTPMVLRRHSAFTSDLLQVIFVHFQVTLTSRRSDFDAASTTLLFHNDSMLFTLRRRFGIALVSCRFASVLPRAHAEFTSMSSGFHSFLVSESIQCRFCATSLPPKFLFGFTSPPIQFRSNVTSSSLR